MPELNLPSDPVTGVSDAISEVAETIRTLSAQTHPLLYMWKIHRLTNLITKDCKKDPRLVPDDIVHSECHDLDPQEQEFILHVVKEKLNPIKQ